MIVGIDMGGTHIDGVIIEDGKIISSIKKPTDQGDLFTSIWFALKELISGFDKSKIKRVNLSTTISTNAIIQKKGPRVGLLVQGGPGIRINPLKEAKTYEISGYIDHRGYVVKDFDPKEVEEKLSSFKKEGIKDLAIVTKFSTRNPEIEKGIKKLVDKETEVSLGHTLSGKLNFPRRIESAFLDASVKRIFSDFANNIKRALEEEGVLAPLYILKADGGTCDLENAMERPVETILSGPAASFMGISSMFKTDKDAILLDIGGTTTDIFFLADGVPLFEEEGIEIGQYKSLVRAIFSHSIGIGGDSAIEVANKNMIIGPNRKGPAYCFGGPVVTPTDAMVFLGLIEGKEREKKLAKEAVKGLSRKLDKDERDIADEIFRIMVRKIRLETDKLLAKINSKPVSTIKELLYGKLLEPKEIYVIGGPAQVLSKYLEKEYKIGCFYPKDYSIANAIGAALAKPTKTISLVANTELRTLSVAELGIYERISTYYNLSDAKERARQLLKAYSDDEIEIIEEESFNTVKDFLTMGKNIRVRAQIKPSHIYDLRGDFN